MGMIVTSMVVGALAAFTTAMGQSWTVADAPQTLQVTQTVVTARLQDVFRNAMAVGVVWPGSLDSSSTQTAGVMLWLNDNMTVDGKIQWGEAAWIEFDPSTDTLKLYECAGTLNAFQKIWAKQSMTSAQWATASTPTSLKAKPFITSKLLATNVLAATFSARDPDDVGGRPSVEFTLLLTQDGQQEVSYGNSALRGATTPQN
jgi:hypothetical protein